MDIQDAIRQRLIEDAPIAAAVARYLNSEAIFWVARPQGSDLRAIVLNTISAPVAEHMKGPQRLQFMRVQADAYADDPTGAQQLADMIVSALQPRDTVGGWYFRPSSVANRRDLTETAADGTTTYRTFLDLIIRYSPA